MSVCIQRSVSFMFDNRKRSKIKNSKIQSWRMELAEFSFTIQYREGKNNVVPDSFTRAHCAAASISLDELHSRLCHPGITRLLHLVKAKNLPFSTKDVRDVCFNCRIRAELKPNFYQRQNNKLIKATRPMERFSIDFKGPLPSSSRNKYFLAVIDDSRFPFVIPCSNMSTETVITCLETIFSLCGMPEFIHSDRGSSFMSAELTNYLRSRGIASSHSTPYHPTGNSQVERYNDIIVWKTVRLALASAKLPDRQWESVLPDALHSLPSFNRHKCRPT